MIFSLYIKGTKKIALCLIVLMSFFKFSVHFLRFSLILEVLCKLMISYFTPIFLTFISYVFELKIYILHQSAVGSLKVPLFGRLYHICHILRHIYKKDADQHSHPTVQSAVTE